VLSEIFEFALLKEEGRQNAIVHLKETVGSVNL
jgi:hypothetical protein